MQHVIPRREVTRLGRSMRRTDCLLQQSGFRVARCIKSPLLQLQPSKRIHRHSDAGCSLFFDELQAVARDQLLGLYAKTNKRVRDLARLGLRLKIRFKNGSSLSSEINTRVTSNFIQRLTLVMFPFTILWRPLLPCWWLAIASLWSISLPSSFPLCCQP